MQGWWTLAYIHWICQSGSQKKPDGSWKMIVNYKFKQIIPLIAVAVLNMINIFTRAD